jgi:hypothetical protein
MKKTLIAIVLVAVVIVGAASVAFGAGLIETPAEITAVLTGKTVDEVTAVRNAGTAYGAQALAAGKFDEFKAQRLEQYKLALEAAVKEGRLTQQQADTLYNIMRTRMEACTGAGTGLGQGGMFGNGTGTGRGSGKGLGSGMGPGSGVRRGGGFGNGACLSLPTN